MNEDEINFTLSLLQEIYNQRKVIIELENSIDNLREIILQQFKLIEDYQIAFRIAKYDTTYINARADELTEEYRRIHHEKS